MTPSLFIRNIKSKGRIIFFLCFFILIDSNSQINPVEAYYVRNEIPMDAKVAFVLIEKHSCLDCLTNMAQIEQDLNQKKYRIQYVISDCRTKFIKENFRLLTNLEPENRLISNDTQLYNFINVFNKQIVVKFNGFKNFEYLFCTNYFDETNDTITIDESEREFKDLNMTFKFNDTSYLVIDHYYEKDMFLLSTKNGRRYAIKPQKLDSVIRSAYKSDLLPTAKTDQILSIFNNLITKKTYKYLNPASFIMNDSEYIFIYKWEKLIFINDSNVVAKSSNIILICDYDFNVKKHIVIKDTPIGDYYVDIYNDNFMYNGNEFIFKLNWLQNSSIMPTAYILAKYQIKKNELVFIEFYRGIQEPWIVKKIHAEYYLDDIVFFKISLDTFFIIKNYPFIYKFGDTLFKIEIPHKNDFTVFNNKTDLLKNKRAKFGIYSIKKIQDKIYMTGYEDNEKIFYIYDNKLRIIKKINLKSDVSESILDIMEDKIIIIKQSEERTLIYNVPY